MPITVTELKIALSVDDSKLKAQLQDVSKQAQSALEGGMKQAAAGAGREVDNVSTRLQQMAASATRVGVGMKAALTAPIVGFARAAIDEAAGFERTFSVLKASVSGTSEQFERAKRLAIELGNDIKLPGTSASDAATAMSEMARRGLDLNNAMSAARGVLQLSAAANISNGQAAKFTATALNAYNLEGSKAGKVADLLAGAQMASGVAASRLAMGIRNGAVAFRLGNQPIETFITSLAILAKNGLEGEKAGTTLRSAIDRLKIPTKDGAAALKEMGVAVRDASTGQLRDLPRILQDLSRGLSSLKPAAADKALKDIFGGPNVSAVTFLLQSMGKEWEETFAKVTKAGSAADLASAQMNGFKGALEAFRSATETLQLTLGERFLPALTNIVLKGTELVNWFTSLPTEVQNAGIAFGLAVAVAGPLLIALGQMADGVAAMRMAWLAVSPTLTPFLPAIAAIGAGLALFAIAWANDWGGIRQVVADVIDRLRPLFDGLGADVRSLWQEITTSFRTGGSQTANEYNAFSRGLSEIHTLMLSGLLTGLRTALNAMTGNWTGVWAAWIDAAVVGANHLVRVFGSLYDRIQTQVVGIARSIGSLVGMGDQLARSATNAMAPFDPRNLQIAAGVAQAGMAAARGGAGDGAGANPMAMLGALQSMESLFTTMSTGVDMAVARSGGIGSAGGRNLPDAGGSSRRGRLTEMQREVSLYNRLLAEATAKLAEAQAGGERADQALAGRLRLLPRAQREHISAILDKVKALNDERKMNEGLDQQYRQITERIRQMRREMGGQGGTQFQEGMNPLKWAKTNAAMLEAKEVEGLKSASDALRQIQLETYKIENPSLLAAISVDRFKKKIEELTVAEKALADALVKETAINQGLKIARDDAAFAAARQALFAKNALATINPQAAAGPTEVFRQLPRTSGVRTPTELMAGHGSGAAMAASEGLGMPEAVRKAQDVQFYLGQASMDFRNNLQGAFQNLMTGRGGIKGFFSDIMGGIRQSFARIAAELLAQWAIRQLLGSAGGQGGAGGGGMAGGQMSGSQVGAAIGMAAGGPIGAAIGGALGGMLKFAGGGRPPMGRASLVGEEGPELFVPDRPGTIYPSGTGPGGAVVHQTVQIYGGINREADESRVAERIAADVQRALRYA
jgi:TP901 family phage tail tape measure protein